MNQPSSTPSRKRLWAVALTTLLGSVIAAACGSGEHAPGLDGVGDGVCVDKDGDGFGTGCWAGPDCDDENAKVVCGGKTPCESNQYAPGCTCPEDGATHECGKVTERSGDYLTCGYGSVRCSAGAWTDCNIDAKRSGFLGMQRILALGAPTPCINNPCDPYCMQFIDRPDRTILHDGGLGLPEGGFRFTDAGMTLSPADGYTFPATFPDGAPPPAPPPTPPPTDLVVTSIMCTPTPAAEVGSTISCTVVVANTGGAWAPTFTNDLRLSTDTTIDNTDTLLEYCGVSALDAGGTVTLTCAGTIPAGTLPGSYYAGFIADSGGTVVESDDGNNTNQTAISIVPPTVTPPPTPPPADLVVTAFTCNAPVSASDTLACTATIDNTGGTWAPTFDNGFWFSTDGTIDAGDTLLGDCTVSGIAALGTATVTCSGTVPAGTPAGPYTVGIVVDPGNVVVETTDANNTFTTAITVSAPPAPPTAADLQVTSITCGSATYPQGGTVSCQVAVVNTGGVWAPPFNDELRLSVDATIDGTDTPLLGDCSIPGLNPGATTTVVCAGTLPIVTALGPFNVGFIADSSALVAESIETNNTASAPITVTAAPAAAPAADLAVTSIACTAPTNYAAGSTVSCDVVVTNTGGTWTGPFTDDFRLSADATIDAGDVLLGNCSISGLNPGASTTVTCTGTIPVVTAPGAFNAGFITDSGGAVPESNEANNTASAPITVDPTPPAGTPPDVVVTSVTCPLASYPIGSTLACSVVFTNNGGTWTGRFDNQLRLSADATITVADPLLATCSVSGLSPGATATVSCSGIVPAPAGAFFAGIIADSGNAVVESLETNNTGSAAITVTTPTPVATPPDISVLGPITCLPSVTQGSSQSCDVTFQNTGGTAAGAFTNQIRLSADATIDATDLLLGTCGLGYLGAGANVTVKCAGTVPAVTAPGGYFAGIIADSGSVIPESNETNNTASDSFAVTAAPAAPTVDITATIACPVNVAQGTTIACDVTFTNSGANAAGTFRSDFYLSNDAAITVADTLLGDCGVGGLPAASSVTVKCAGTVPSGAGVGITYAGVIADSTGLIVESNEGNNTTATGFVVTAAPTPPTPADLVVQSVTCGSPVEAGSTVACTVVLRNAGSAWASAFGNDLYLSADTNLTGIDINIGSCSSAGIAGGATATVTCAGTVPAGTAVGGWNAIVSEDSANAVPESNEGNNTGAGAFAVTAPSVSSSPDIIASDVSCTVAHVNAGGALTCNVKFTNQGGGNAVAFTSQLRLSVDNVITGADTSLTGVVCNTGALAAGSSATVACTGTVPGGTANGFYYLGVIADSGAAVGESNEGNNTNYTFVTVPVVSQAFDLLPSGSTFAQPTAPPLASKTNGIEVFFLLDISGTMQSALLQLKSSMVSVVSNIQTLGFGPYPAIPTAKFGVGHFSGYDFAPYNQNAPSAAYQQPQILYTSTAVAAAGQPLLPVQNAAGTAATATQARDAILAWDPATPVFPYKTRGPNNDEGESWTMAAFAEMDPTGGGLRRTAGPTYWVAPRPGGLCPAGAKGYPCFSAGATPITVVFTDNPSPNGPGGLFAFGHHSTDAGFVDTYAPVQGTPNWPAATVIPGLPGNTTELTAVTIDPTVFQRFKGTFSALGLFSNISLPYYNGTRNFPTSYADWYFGTGDARDLCGSDGNNAAGGEAFFKFSLGTRSFVHFDTYGSNLDTYLYVIDRTLAHGDSVNKVVTCQDYQHALYVNGGPQGRIYTTWSGGPPAPSNANPFTGTPAGVTDLNAYLDAGDYTLVVDRKTGTGGNYFLTVNAYPETGGQGVSPAAAPTTPTMPTFEQMVSAHNAVGGSIIGVDVSGMGPVNAGGSAFTRCQSNYKIGHRADRWTYVTLQEAARQTGAINSADANTWTNPYVFSVDMNGLPCLGGDAPLADRISTAILDLTANNLRADIAFRAVDTDDATDFDGTGGTPVLTPTNCDEGVNGNCAGTSYVNALGVFIISAAPTANARCQDDVATDGILEGCLPGTAVQFNPVYGVPNGFTRLCNDQAFQFDVEAYVKTATCTPGVDCYSMGKKPVTITVPGDSTACAVTGTADLSVMSISCGTPVAAGGTLSCDITIQNTGGLASPAFTSRLVLSGDTAIAAPPDVSLTTCGSSGIAASGGQHTITCTGVVPSGTTPGAYFGGIIIDSAGAVPETNEGNNTGSAAITVSAAPTPPAAADLIVSGIAGCTPSIGQGDTVSCNVTFRNQGATDAGPFTNAIRLSGDAVITAADTLLGTCGLSYLAAGASTTVTCAGAIPSATAAGTWYAGFVADSGGVIAETVETNNTGAQSFGVTVSTVAVPDLVVQSIACSTPVDQGTTLSCAVTVRNQGGSWAGAFTNELRLSADAAITGGDALLTTCSSSGVGAGSTVAMICAVTLPAATALGPWFAGVMVDTTAAVAESTETNNTGSVAITVTAPTVAATPADLIVQAVSCVPGTVDQGATLSCNVTFRNNGGTPVTTFTNDLRLSADATITNADLLLGNCGVATLAAATNVVVACSGTVPLPTAAGPWFAGVIADSSAVVPESSETNNTGSAAVTVAVAPVAAPPADIAVAGVSCPTATLAQGDTLACDVTLTNTGSTPAGVFVNTLRLSADATITAADVLLGTCGVANLAAGGSAIVKCSGTVPGATAAGPWFAGFIADSGTAIPESNEANNTGSTAVTVTVAPPPPLPPDIVVTAVTCQASVAQGGTLACIVDLSNNGTTGATFFGNALRLSTDVVIDATDLLLGNCGVAVLPAGGTATVDCAGSIPGATAVGPWNAGVIADPAPPAGGLVTETNETNNTGSTAFVVTAAPASPLPADLEVTTVVCPPTVAQGDTLTCDVTFTNLGTTPSGAFEDEFRLSTDTTITAADTLLGHCGVSNLVAGGMVTVKCSGPVDIATPIGAINAGAIADSAGAVPEGSEANNTNATSVTVTLAPVAPPALGADIVVTAVTCPTTVEQGATLTCDVTFTNSGASVAGTFMDELRLSADATIDATDVLVGNCGFSGLAVGTPVTIKCGGMIAAATATGAWFAGVLADTTAAVTELDETNNTLSTAVTVDPAPLTGPPAGSDIVVDSVSCLPSTLNPGDAISCTVSLRNQGGTDAAAFTNDIRLSLDRTIDGTDTLLTTCNAAALVAGATETITCATNLPVGMTLGLYYYVGVMADSAGVVTEFEEANNTSYDPILVAAPPPEYGSARYERDYDGRNLCPGGYSPVWGLFSWNATTPKDSHIDFSVQTAPTNVGLNVAQSVPIAVAGRATAGTPPGYGGGTYPTLSGTGDTQAGSVIVNTVLEATDLPTQEVWLRVRMSLVGSSDQLTPPSLGAWGLQVGCVASQ